LIDAPRVLFVPVSGPFGMGEFARSSAIARALLARWPGAGVHFMLSRAAPYAAAVPFPTTLLASSPTFHSAAVNELIRSWRPHVVVFDNAGRTAQLKAAHTHGARVVYISSRRRQRGKAFRLRWMRLMDEHWIAYPKVIAGELNLVERLKLAWLHRPTVRYLDVIMAPAPAVSAASGVDDAARAARGYVLVIPGGGTGHPGAEGATQAFLDAAKRLAQYGFETLFVGPARAGALTAHLRMMGALPQPELARWMRGARLIVVNGGSTLLQALACGAAVVAAPIARDQRERIERCARAGAALEAAPDAGDMALKAKSLLDDEPARLALAHRAAALGLADGVQVALDALAAFIEA
jgi:glycosyltransferase involved in cell wall biosynthesis